MFNKTIKLSAQNAERTWGKAYGLFSCILQKRQLKTGAELGVAYGGHCEEILKNTSVTRLYGIDPYRHLENYDDPMNVSQERFDEIRTFVKGRLKPYKNRFQFIRKTAQAAVDSVPDNLDFIYIDADHSYQSVANDLKTWFTKVKDYGIIGGHDYGHPNFPGVKQAVNEFFGRFDWKIHEEGEGVWWVEKPPLNISFIIPAYNCANTIQEATASILKTNFTKGDEVVIVDDASTDQTYKIAKQITEKHSNIKVQQHLFNQGGGAARNTAVDHAQNTLIFCLDADNILAPGSIKKLKDHFLTSGADIASFEKLLYFKDSIKKITHTWKFPQKTTTIAGSLSHIKIPGASGNYLFTKSSWQETLGYPEFAGALDTWGFYIRQLVNGAKVVILPSSYYYHRFGHNSYWVREFKRKNTSLTALQIIIPFIDLIDEKSIDYMFSKKGRLCWFDNREKKPIKLREVKPKRQSKSNNLIQNFRKVFANKI
jgi:glycosyltransferase involved in cell wall biosynthesis